MRRPGLWFSGALLVVAVTLTGCGTTSLQSPENPVEPRAVFVIDHGRHTSIAVEAVSGNLHRYSYGDTRYYRDQDTSLWSGAAALLWPTPATLGRAELVAVADDSALRDQLVVGVEEILVLEVAGEHADRLIDELDVIHQQGAAEHVFVRAYGLVFAPHPTDYVWWHNSSTVVAGWLKDMGVEVHGFGLLASWELKEN
jgi:hypothetical protein